MSVGSVNGQINDLYTRIVPAGCILMWSGSIGSIPLGWRICDGGGGTPDLRDRFIVGAGNSYGVGNTGGANSVQLTLNEIPSHSHGVNDPGHTHRDRWLQSYAAGGNNGYAGNAGVIGSNDNNQSVQFKTTGISIQSAGGSASHENRPPYYALAYIMKL